MFLLICLRVGAFFIYLSLYYALHYCNKSRLSSSHLEYSYVYSLESGVKNCLILTLVLLLDVNHIDYSTYNIYENICLLYVSIGFIMWMNNSKDPNLLASSEAI